MSAKPNYTKGQINALPLGPLKEALEALGIPFNGGKIAGRKSLKAALYPDTAAVSQPNPSQLSSSQPSGASGSAKYVSASQPNLSHVPPIQPCPAPPDQVPVGNNIQAEGRERGTSLLKPMDQFTPESLSQVEIRPAVFTVRC